MGRTMVGYETDGDIEMSGWEMSGWDSWDDQQDRYGIDWAASCRLALVVSIAAALAAIVLSAIVGETALVVSVIVAATAVSWFHLEHGQLSRPIPRTVPVRRD